MHEQHLTLQAPEAHSAPSYSIQAAPAVAIQHSQEVVSVQQHQQALAVQQVQHAQPAILHHGPQSLSQFGDSVVQGHAINGQLVNEQLVNGQLENGALVSHSHGPVAVVRVCEYIFI